MTESDYDYYVSVRESLKSDGYLSVRPNFTAHRRFQMKSLPEMVRTGVSL